MIGTFMVFAITVLPSDRMAMADRLFNNGKYNSLVVRPVAAFTYTVQP